MGSGVVDPVGSAMFIVLPNTDPDRDRLTIHMFLGLLDPHPEALVRGTDPRIRIRIRTNMSRIRNTDFNQEVKINDAFFHKNSINCPNYKKNYDTYDADEKEKSMFSRLAPVRLKVKFLVQIFQHV